MNDIVKCLISLFAFLLILASASVPVYSAPAVAPELGRWNTQSGALEVEIAPCGSQYCGTIVRVISNATMAGPKDRMPPTVGKAAGSPIGMEILTGLHASGGAGFKGFIYNRANNKTYNTLVELNGPDLLKVTIYEDIPDKGQVQLWHRADAAQSSSRN